jgi:hypothetical protein
VLIENVSHCVGFSQEISDQPMESACMLYLGPVATLAKYMQLRARNYFRKSQRSGQWKNTILATMDHQSLMSKGSDLVF